jgi:threonine/homoserine/homoserine lactone efflux protein
MVPVRHVLEFAVLAAVLIAIPGPSVLFIVSRSPTGKLAITPRCAKASR